MHYMLRMDCWCCCLRWLQWWNAFWGAFTDYKTAHSLSIIVADFMSWTYHYDYYYFVVTIIISSLSLTVVCVSRQAHNFPKLQHNNVIIVSSSMRCLWIKFSGECDVHYHFLINRKYVHDIDYDTAIIKSLQFAFKVISIEIYMWNFWH
jgi:hypothetical protein